MRVPHTSIRTAFVLSIAVSLLASGLSGCASIMGAKIGGGIKPNALFSGVLPKSIWLSRDDRNRTSRELSRKAGELARRGRYVQAIELATSAIQMVPSDVGNHLLLANIFQQSGQIANAITQLKRGLEIDEKSPDLNLEIGKIFQGQRRYDAALAAARRVLKVDPRHIEALRLETESHYHLKQDPLALGAGFRLLAQKPNDEATKVILCRVYCRMGRPERSWSLLQQVVSMYADRKLPRNLRILEVETLVLMNRRSDADLCLQRWSQDGGQNEPLCIDWVQRVSPRSHRVPGTAPSLLRPIEHATTPGGSPVMLAGQRSPTMRVAQVNHLQEARAEQPPKERKQPRSFRPILPVRNFR